jgi:penicillin-binding protein 1C
VGPTARGLALSARGEDLSWYVEGQPLAADAVSGRVIWKPPSAGFYRISVVDPAGREAAATVRIRAGG